MEQKRTVLHIALRHLSANVTHNLQNRQNTDNYYYLLNVTGQTLSMQRTHGYKETQPMKDALLQICMAKKYIASTLHPSIFNSIS